MRRHSNRRYNVGQDSSLVTSMLSSLTTAVADSSQYHITTVDQSQSVTIIFNTTTLNLLPVRYVEIMTFGGITTVKIRYAMGTTNVTNANFVLIFNGNTDLGTKIMVTDQSGVIASQLTGIYSMGSAINCVSSAPHVPGFIDLWYQRVDVISKPRIKSVVSIGDATITTSSQDKETEFDDCPQCGRESILKDVCGATWLYCPIHGWQDMSIVESKLQLSEDVIRSVSNDRPIINDHKVDFNCVISEYKLKDNLVLDSNQSYEDQILVSKSSTS